jgi:hypothetical protein
LVNNFFGLEPSSANNFYFLIILTVETASRNNIAKDSTIHNPVLPFSKWKNSPLLAGQPQPMGGENSPGPQRRTNQKRLAACSGGKQGTERQQWHWGLISEKPEEEGFRLTVGLKVTVMFSSSLLVNFTDCCPGHCFGKEKYIYQTGHCTISSVFEEYDKITNTKTQMLPAKKVTS